MLLGRLSSWMDVSFFAPDPCRELWTDMLDSRQLAAIREQRPDVAWLYDGEPALLGNWGREGGFYFPASFALAKYPYPPYPHGERGAVDNPDAKYPFADLGLTNGIRAATISGAPYPIKGWFVYATNLLQALPNQEETIRAIQALDHPLHDAHQPRVHPVQSPVHRALPPVNGPGGRVLRPRAPSPWQPHVRSHSLRAPPPTAAYLHRPPAPQKKPPLYACEKQKGHRAVQRMMVRRR